MCGFVGFFNDHNLSIESFQKTINTLEHRGPDDSGNWVDLDKKLFLGHRRLSVLDTSKSGSQPMQSSNKRYVIVYNGEIYNHLEIREQIEKKSKDPIIWKSSSDTETLIESISLLGIEATLDKINGMFSFVIYDKKENNLIFARDRFGEKPLYYGQIGQVLFFSSDLVVLKEYKNIDMEVDEKSIYYLLQYNYIPQQLSIFKNIKKLPPSSFLTVNLNDFKNNGLDSIRNKKYWSLPKNYSHEIENYNHLDERLEKLLTKSVKLQTISDVPVGAFLSGGIDSSLIVSILQSQSRMPINTFTIGFHEKEFNEAKKADEISKFLNTNHNEVYFSSKDAQDLIPDLPKVFSEPFADPSMLPTILISKIARKSVTVALSGDGGDEIFGGYNRYKMLPTIRKIKSFIPSIMHNPIFNFYNLFSDNLWDSFGKSLNIDQGSDKLRKVFNIFNSKDDVLSYINILQNTNLSDSILINNTSKDLIKENIMNRSAIKSIENLMMYIDQNNYLPDDILVKLDRSAMMSSLETRVPFLDRNVVEFAAGIPMRLKIDKKNNKVILRKILSKYLPKNIIDNQKSGFNAPIDQWLRGPLKEWSEDIIYSKNFKISPYFDHSKVISIWKEHISERRNLYRPLWSILIFQSWLEYNNI